MTVGRLSTLSSQEQIRSIIARTQERFDQATREVTSGRHHDVGIVLGRATTQSIDARQSIADLDAILRSNQITDARLSTAQSSLSAATSMANDFFETIISTRQAGSDRGLLVEEARNMLGSLTALLSATSNGTHVFGGLTTTQAPFADYIKDPAQTGRTAIIGAFAAEFGFTPDDPQATAITSAQMQTYLSGRYAAQFEDPAWQSSFSSATDGGVELRIAPHDVATMRFSANDKGIRMLVSALVAAIDSGTTQLNAETFDAFASSLAETVSAAANEITRNRSAIGSLQERITEASDRIAIGRGLLEQTVGKLENVDLGEASIRLNELATKLDTSFAVTARIQRLSLLNYL